MSAPAPGAPPAIATAAAARVTLFVFTLLNFVNYIDRYVLPPVIEKIKGDPAFHGTSDAQMGQLQTAFFVVYMIFSPIAGLLGRRVPRRYLVALGVGIWSVATVLSGLARGFGELFAARALIGAGEGGYATLAPAILSDLFGPGRRSRVMAIFYVATPVGSALGMILGGFVAQHWSWRAAFFVAGGPGLLLALIVLLLPEPVRGAQDVPVAPSEPLLRGAGSVAGRDAHGRLAHTTIGDELRALVRNAAYLRVTAANTLLAFSIGGLAFWLPSYFQEARGLDAEKAGLVVGLSAVGAGLLGTLAGGFLGDYWLKRDRNALFRISGAGVLLGVPLVALAPFASDMSVTIALIFCAEFFFFLNTGPLNTALVESAPATFREGAVGIHIFTIHLLGDALSPALLGALAGALASYGRGRALGIAAASVALPLFVCALVMLIGLERNKPPGDSRA